MSKYDENLVETALIFLKDGNYPALHDLELSEEEKAHVENQMSIEQELSYEAYVKSLQDLKADVDDEISKHD